MIRKAYCVGRIRTVYDIGGHKADGRGICRVMPDAHCILFKSNPRHKEELAPTGFEHYIGVLSRPNIMELSFFSREDDAGSTGGSTYKKKRPQYRDVQPVRWPARTLDSLVAEGRLPAPDLVKLDTQGSKLDVIAAGRDSSRKRSMC